MRRRKVLWTLVGLGCCLMITPVALGQGTITSPDGGWEASLDVFGQVQDFYPPDQPGVDNIFDSAMYVASTHTNQLSRRVDTSYVTTVKEINDHDAFFRLEKTDYPLSIEIAVEMLNGPSGGIQYDVWYINKGSDAISVKPFYYVDFDISGDFGDDMVTKLEAGFEHSDYPGEKPLWFISKGGAKSWEAALYYDLGGKLDAGIDQLDHGIFGTAPNDFTSAISWEKVELLPGETYKIGFGIGGPGIPEPGTVALLGLGSLALLRRRARC